MSRPPSSRRRRWLAGMAMAFLAAAAAVVSYIDGLSVVHTAGVAGQVAYLYPLLPDGLIVIATMALYEAKREGGTRPRWATAGIALGAVLTVAQNVAAGAGIVVPLALVDGLVPVVFFVALEIFIGHIRRGRDGSPASDTPAVPATSIQADPPAPPAVPDALKVLLAAGSQRGLAATLGVPKSRVQAWAAMAREVDASPPAGAGISDPPSVPGRGPKDPPVVAAAGDGARVPPVPGAVVLAGSSPVPAGATSSTNGQHPERR